MQANPQKFNIAVVGQNNRLQYEALLFAASLRHSSPQFEGSLFVATPNPGPRWSQNPSIQDEDVLKGAETVRRRSPAIRLACLW